MVAHLKILLTISLTAVLDLCLLTFALYLIVKVYKLIKFTDLPMLLSVISVVLALICLLIFCILDIMSMFVDDTSFFNTNSG